jgi:hypothetical protein
LTGSTLENVSHPHVPARLQLLDLQSTRLGIALWGGLALLDLGRSVGAAPLVQVAAVTALVGICSRGVDRVVAACVAGIGWLLLNGFVVHAWGQLGFVGTGDVVRAALVLGAALGVNELAR